MFNKRKPIVIGETYIFDALNESNLASGTSLVTVIKKTGRHTYSVISVNNGYVFECPEVLLTPYIDPEKAYVIRCKYGETEFNHFDVEYFDKVPFSFIDQLKEMTVKMEGMSEFTTVLDMAKELTEGLKNKVKKYAHISEHKYNLKISGNPFTKAKQVIKENVPDFMLPPTAKQVASPYPNGNNRFKNVPPPTDDYIFTNGNKAMLGEEFRQKFDAALGGYVNGQHDVDDFVTIATHIIQTCYPKSFLKMSDRVLINRARITDTVSTLMLEKEEGSIMFFISIDAKTGHIFTEVVLPDDEEDDMVEHARNFILRMYPGLEKALTTHSDITMSLISVASPEEYLNGDEYDD